MEVELQVRSLGLEHLDIQARIATLSGATAPSPWPAALDSTRLDTVISTPNPSHRFILVQAHVILPRGPQEPCLISPWAGWPQKHTPRPSTIIHFIETKFQSPDSQGLHSKSNKTTPSSARPTYIQHLPPQYTTPNLNPKSQLYTQAQSSPSPTNPQASDDSRIDTAKPAMKKRTRAKRGDPNQHVDLPLFPFLART